ncbi:hypothetical protein LLEC1_07302 [Akanthomyces lecanii]|uniref:PH domain-containing protein n=1 Tax=Cordyceps confragosa TaxID=2714763 RepID=A0A179IHK5_CORDF|nr:hypothetical protein LLEC1_07302 [Akanthomyces lecanii]
MSDAGDSTHKRSRSSAALALLRRRETRDEESGSDDARSTTGGAASTKQSSKSSILPISRAISHTSKLSLSRTPSKQQQPQQQQQQPAPPAMKSAAPALDKGPSLEQSVRKFRVVEALRNGDTAAISKIIRESADGVRRASVSSNATSATTAPTALEDTTVLHLALQCADFPVIEYVLSDGAGMVDVNARDREGNTPLHIAATHGRTAAVKLLLERKDINEALVNLQGKFPIDLAKNPEIFQLLQLSRSLFTDSKVRQVQELIAKGDYDTLAQVLEEPRLKAVLDINSPEFVSESVTLQTGGTLLHEAARKKNIALIQVLLLHGADPFRRDRKGKLAQSISHDDAIKSILKKSPAAVAAQRGIQEKAVLGQAATQGAAAGAGGELVAGKEAREMKGYLKKWTNYRKGYQLRWFVLEDGVLSYYKHQDDAGSACRGAINMRIARLHMSPDEKTKFEIIGKSSVKYTLKANHEVEAKRWFWALNNSIQWTKDQAKEEEKQTVRNAELLRQAKADPNTLSVQESHSESASISDYRQSSSHQPTRSTSSAMLSPQKNDLTRASTTGSVDDEDVLDATTDGGVSRAHDGAELIPGEEDDDDFDDHSVRQDPSATKDALNITAQSAKLQLETMTGVHNALMMELSQRPATPLSDTRVTQALSTYDAAIRSLTGLIGDLMRISKDRDAFWKYRLERETNMRQMWEESMAHVAREQEILEARVDESEKKRKITKKALREVMEGGTPLDGTPVQEKAQEDVQTTPMAPGNRSLTRQKTALDQVAGFSDSDSDDGEEFFDAVDSGEVEVTELPESQPTEAQAVVSSSMDLSPSFRGYENGIRHRLKMDADDRPKISLWGILKSMIGKDMTKMTLPVSFNEPTSLLYRCGEDMEYSDLLDMAASRPDSLERLIYVAAFAASEYASSIGRVAKPFNPLLGETFEYVRPDKNYRFFTEQVSHHPPIGAAWAESPNWTYWGESNVKSKFYGKSFDVAHLGTWFLKIRPTNGGKEDFYSWKKVTSSVIGIITGNPTIDHYGTMEVKNWTTGEVAILEMKPRGWKVSSAYQVAGKVMDSDGGVRFSMGGRWNSKLYARLTPGYEANLDASGKGSNDEKVHSGGMTDPSRAYLVWQANERPTGIPFNLTPFVLTFNHIDDKLKQWIAPTDSRLRPDQRAMEDGEYDFAATEKNRLEENQRARRRKREESGEHFTPAWFSRARCEVTGEQYWQFNHKYWKQRENAGPDGDPKVWGGLEPIFQDEAATVEE